MKSTKTLFFLALLSFVSCEENEPIILEPVQSDQIANLFAPQNGGQGQGPISGIFTLFDFDTGEITTDPDAWDIGFRATTIIVNGGDSSGTTDEPDRTRNAAAYISTGGLASVVEVDETLFRQDASNAFAIPASSDQGWYNYSGFGNQNPVLDNLVTPLPGRVLVLRTTEGRFAKMEIVSYYKDAPENPNGFIHEGRYYTFNYVYQPNEGVLTFE